MPELDRRDFLKIVGLSAGAAATAACQEPVERVIPYLNHPEEIVPGIPTYYASTCRECPAACGISVKTREGRPIKVDGNPADPVSQGRLCVRGQASLYRTYDAARFAGPMLRNASGQRVATTWAEGLALLVAKLSEAPAGKVTFLGGLETGALDGLIDQFLAAIGSPNRLRLEMFAHEALRSANQIVFGTDAVPHFALDRADVLVSFGADFLETWLNPLQNQVLYANARREGQGYAVHVGPRLSLSGANTDLWLDPEPGQEILVALALAREVARRRAVDLGPVGRTLERYAAPAVADRTGIAASRIEAVAQRMVEAQAPLALPPGNELQGTNATQFAAAVQILNYASGALGKTLVFGPDHNVASLARFGDVKELAGRMRGGEVGVLLVHNANPVYAAPQVGFADAMREPGVFTVSFSSADDETTALADLVLPDHTPYESWGEAEPILGVRRLQQPTVQPLMNTRALGDVLLEVGRTLGHQGVLPAGTFREVLAAGWGVPGFDLALAKGGRFEPAPERSVSLSEEAATLEFEPASLTGKGELALVVYPSLHLYDGRSARIAMLQEVPHPSTKLVWGSHAELHPETAAQLGVADGEIVRVATERGSLELAVFSHEAVRPGVVAIEAGQGHQPVDPAAPDPDRLGRRRTIGVHALELLPGRIDSASGALAWLAARASVEPTGRRQLMAKTQRTFDQEDRGIAQTLTLAAFLGLEQSPPPVPDEEHGHAPPYADAAHLQTVDFDPAGDARDPNYRWGMTIDLDSCMGCNACITACVQENNISTIGETLVRQGREMHWVRIERWLENQGGAPEVRHVPVLCQQCGAAPCESVCPVYATYHSREGLNVMVQNRCIGTRYCSNNCPYKARRFNYFPYDQGIPAPEHLALNPDVNVRTKGVMEKCTFCVQRINDAKDRAVLEGRTVGEGEFTTACAQSCPSGAITFGNYNDPESEISKQRRDQRAYWVFQHLNTRPAVTYLKSIQRNETQKA